MYPVEADIRPPDLKRRYWSEFVCVGLMVRAAEIELWSQSFFVCVWVSWCRQRNLNRGSGNFLRVRTIWPSL
jgi:hypothetical protein